MIASANWSRPDLRLPSMDAQVRQLSLILQIFVKYCNYGSGRFSLQVHAVERAFCHKGQLPWSLYASPNQLSRSNLSAPRRDWDLRAQAVKQSCKIIVRTVGLSIMHTQLVGALRRRPSACDDLQQLVLSIRDNAALTPGGS